ncbi:PREDICTED: uncharacterized protein LOC104774122 [Camelina sativa]|uniref:Uncharacterized protein LOC104774122 n=1 Tax=Camelina sativa TaxID=90675 RepID=A0ABM0Y8A0_CAMSA|nr:PREDICTED: uncharacterized protein LOC104774122 [Camelina sativa]
MATTSAFSTTTTKELITSSPYHLSSNDQPHHVLTLFLLNGEEYDKWAKIARNNLATKHKLGLVDGTLLKPATDSPDYQWWVQVNSMLCGWLYASLDPQVQKVIPFVDNAKVLWDNLRVRYSIGNASRVHQIKSSIARCAQDGQHVADYFGQLKVMWDDLDDFEPFIDCCCNSPSCPQRLKQQARRDLERIHQFLMGLDASRFEEHIDVVGFAVKAGVNAIASATRLTQGPCTHCGRTNHSVDTCFELHGLPDWWIEKHGDTRGGSRSDSTRGRGRGHSSPASYRANNAQAFSEAELPDLPGVSKATWSAIVNLLKPDQTSGFDKLSGKHSCVEFLLDSGASHHMIGDDDLLVDAHDIPRSIVVLPNGNNTFATKEGTMILGDHVKLNCVLYVPDLSCTLISLARICRELSCYALFTDTLGVIQDHTLKMLIGAGEERDGVSHFRGVVSACVKNVKKSTRTLWHERLGHPSTKILSSFFYLLYRILHTIVVIIMIFVKFVFKLNKRG